MPFSVRALRWRTAVAAVAIAASCSQKVMLIRATNLTDQPVYVHVRLANRSSANSKMVLPGETITIDGAEYNTLCNLPLRELPESIVGLSVTYPSGEVLTVDRQDLEREADAPRWFYEVKDIEPAPR